MSWFSRKRKIVTDVDPTSLERSVVQIVKDTITRAFFDAESALTRIKSTAELTDKITKLKEELETLHIEKGRKEEDFQKREREIEHKVGLERKRQEFELAQAKRETSVTVREENLAADKKRFEESMKFQNDRFTTEVGYLKDMLTEMMKRLPSAEVFIRHSSKESTSNKSGGKPVKE